MSEEVNFDFKCEISSLNLMLKTINHFLGRQKSSFLEKKIWMDQNCNKYGMKSSQDGYRIMSPSPNLNCGTFFPILTRKKFSSLGPQMGKSPRKIPARDKNVNNKIRTK
jgi:hypothetical protein